MDRKPKDNRSDPSGLPQGFFVLCRWVDRLAKITMILFMAASFIANYVFDKSLFGYQMSVFGILAIPVFLRWMPYYMAKFAISLKLVSDRFWLGYLPKVILFVLFVSILWLRDGVFGFLMVFWLAGALAHYVRKYWDKPRREDT